MNIYYPIYILGIFSIYFIISPTGPSRKEKKILKTKGIDDRLTVQNTDELNKYYPKYKTVSKMRIMWQNLPS